MAKDCRVWSTSRRVKYRFRQHRNTKFEGDCELHNRLVRNKRLALTIPLIIAVSLLLPSPTVSSAHAQLTGLVCITDSISATGCPASPPVMGPLILGSTFSVGVFVQNSDPMGGWDIYVAADPAFLSPTSAALGTLITSPTLTSICINGVAATGSCTVNTANGPGVVEAAAIESSGLNDCNTPSGPCSGMAFNITYTVVGPAPSTSILYPSATSCSPGSVTGSDACVLIADNFGNPLLENIQGANITQNVDPTTTSVGCAPSSVMVGTSTICTATVTDTAAANATSPTGTVSFTTDGPGNFSPSLVCNLSAVGANQAQCSTMLTPSMVGTGTDNIGAMYSGDSSHATSTAPRFPVTVTFAPSDFSISAASTSLSIPSGGVGTDKLTATGLGSFTGSVTLSNLSVLLGVTVIFVPNPVTITTAGGTATSDMNVFIDPALAAGTSFTLTETGMSGSLYHTVSINVTVTSAPNPTLAGGKIHWTRHLSLAKNSNAQTWTAIVANPLLTSINVLIRIVGQSPTNPLLGFDVTCGVTCVNTAGGVNLTPGLTSVSVAAGSKSFSFSFSQTISGSFVNQSVSFTATLYWTASTVYARSDSKSGTFAVTP